MNTDWQDFHCPACYSPTYVVRFPIEKRYMVQCTKCLSEMIWPLPSEAELADYYSTPTEYNMRSRQEAARYLNNETNWHNVAAEHGQKLAERGIFRNCRWVEIGCSYGFQAIEMRKQGYDAWGVEYSQEAVDFINANGGKAYCGSIFDPEFPVQHIDYCFTQSAFEHMRDPYRVARRIMDLLVPGGLLCVQIPNWGSLSARINQKRWHWLAPPDHLHYFRPEVFSAFLTSIGFITEEITVTGYPEEVDQIYDMLGIAETSRTPETRDVISRMLTEGWLGNQFRITARKPETGDMAAARPKGL